MAKYSERLADKIVALIEEDSYTISEICEILRISRKSFYEWKNTKPDFEKKVEEAFEKRDEALEQLARNSLKRRLNGYTLTEVKITYEPDGFDSSEMKIKKKEVRQKEYAPDIKAIKYILERKERKEIKQTDDEYRNPPLNIYVQNEEAKQNLLRLKESLSRKGS